LTKNAAGAQFNDRRTWEWEHLGIVEVGFNARPGKSSYLFDVQFTPLKTLEVPKATMLKVAYSSLSSAGESVVPKKKMSWLKFKKDILFLAV